MATLGEIQAEVARIVEDDPTDVMASAALRTHVRRAQRAIEDRCAFAIQEQVTTYVVTASAVQFGLPDGYITARRDPTFLARSNSTRRSVVTEYENMEELPLASPGRPQYWRVAQDFYFEVWPQGDGLGPSGTTPGGYDVTFYYWQRQPTLTAPEDTNYWTANMDDVLAWRAAAFAFSELRDAQANWWSAVAAARFDEIVKAYNRNKIRQREFRLYPSQQLSSRTTVMRRRDPRLDADLP